MPEIENKDIENSAKPRIKVPTRAEREKMRSLIEKMGLNTVCKEAACPNIWECFQRHTATFMIIGDVCTRNCRFCNVRTGRPAPLDPGEPERLASAIKELGLKYAVITCVTRDDLPDGGAEHFVKTIEAVRAVSPETKVEILTSDFAGNSAALEKVLRARPAVFNHNLETVERLTPTLRTKATYLRSLAVLNYACRLFPDIPVKSGIMVGCGETMEEVFGAIRDLKAAGCSLLTVGQYLAPDEKCHPVEKYYSEHEFAEIKAYALDLGFVGAACGPLVRSSYRAGEMAERVYG
ncbi:lipoyl synthase [bacterium]|nr:lipoyl synthase [bacterium]